MHMIKQMIPSRKPLLIAATGLNGACVRFRPVVDLASVTVERGFGGEGWVGTGGHGAAVLGGWSAGC